MNISVYTSYTEDGTLDSISSTFLGSSMSFALILTLCCPGFIHFAFPHFRDKPLVNSVPSHSFLFFFFSFSSYHRRVVPFSSFASVKPVTTMCIRTVLTSSHGNNNAIYCFGACEWYYHSAHFPFGLFSHGSYPI